jgi:uncharacterized protein
MAGYFEIKTAANGEVMFNLKAGNHEIILTSEAYKSRAALDNGIESVRKNAADDARYTKTTTPTGKFRFALTATNGQTIGTSENYESAGARDNGVESVMKNAPDATIKDIT